MRRMRMIRVASVFLGVVAGVMSVALAAGEVYRWQDDSGQYHYGDTTNKPGHAEEIKVDTRDRGTRPSAERRERQRKFLRAREEERAWNEKQAAKARKKKARRSRQCAEGRERLAAYRKAGTLYEEKEDGSRRYIVDGERQEVIDTLEEQIEEKCS